MTDTQAGGWLDDARPVMHDPALIEAMALRFCLTRTLETQGRSELACTSACASCQTAMDAALCTARPDVAAVLRGEAVVVPREATKEMMEADPYGMGYGRLHAIYRAMLAASPLAQEPNDAE